jgi:hypothetical protein
MTDKINTGIACWCVSLDTPTLKTAEITGRKGDMQINPDGTKTMEVGGKKMIYQWNDDLNICIYKCDFFITPRCFYAKRF